MDVMKCSDVIDMFACVSEEFAEQKDTLCEMDAKMGDGDLGLTMSKGYGALPQLLKDNSAEGDIGKMLMKGGMKMSSVVPSTMGTLMSSGIMEGGKALKGKTELTPADLSAFLTGFAAGIVKRGKCQPGDRTILDALKPASEAAAAAAEQGGAFTDVIDAALKGAADGVEATKDMTPKYGKAAVFAAKAKGVADQGATAGYDLIEGMHRYFHK